MVGTSRCVLTMGQNAHAKKDTDPAGEEANPTRMMCADEGLVGLVWFGLGLLASLLSAPCRSVIVPTQRKARCSKELMCAFEFIWRVAPAGHRRNFLNYRDRLSLPYPGDFNPIEIYNVDLHFNMYVR